MLSKLEGEVRTSVHPEVVALLDHLVDSMAEKADKDASEDPEVLHARMLAMDKLRDLTNATDALLVAIRAATFDFRQVRK